MPVLAVATGVSGDRVTGGCFAANDALYAALYALSALNARLIDTQPLQKMHVARVGGNAEALGTALRYYSMSTSRCIIVCSSALHHFVPGQLNLARTCSGQQPLRGTPARSLV